MLLNVREEQGSDVDPVFHLVRAAFERHPFGDHSEHFIVNALRRAGAMTLSLVAEVGGEVVGHVAFSPVTISDGSDGWYGLGPLAVSPVFQGRGIGSLLVREGLSRLKSLGAEGCILLGDPGYYGRFGFRNTPDLVLEGVPPHYFLALQFGERAAHGTVLFHKAFSARD